MKVLELAKKKLSGTLNALLEFICLLWLQHGSEVLDVFLNVSHERFLVKRGLLLQTGINGLVQKKTYAQGTVKIKNNS